MEQERAQLDGKTFFCQLCLDLLEDGVTIPCGHNYCMNCTKSFRDGEDEKKIHRCPQCGQIFTNLEVVKEEMKTGLQAAPADPCYAGPEDVACDFCPGRKALKSCMQCLVSYCETHLQPHYDVPQFKKHKLVEPSEFQENICSRHNEVKTMFCRTDRQCICYLCPVDEHKGHDTVSAAVESTERQRELEENIQQRIQDSERDLKLLQQEVEAINRSADEAVEDSETIFNELMCFLETRSSDLKQQLRTQQETEVSRVKQLQEKLQQEVTELKRKDAELKKLSLTEDHNRFLGSYPSLSELGEAADSIGSNISLLTYFEDAKAAVSEIRGKPLDVLNETWKSISWAVSNVDVLLKPKVKSRAELLKYSREITMDPNTAYRHLLLSEGNREATRVMGAQSYSIHPDRFTGCNQVLSAESLTGRSYWEVEMKVGRNQVAVAVAYKTIQRDGYGGECSFGQNDKSWALMFANTRYQFFYNNISTCVSCPPYSRIGVYVDHSAGILEFYGISEKATRILKVQTTFTQPLYAGLRIDYCNTAEFCKLK